MATEGPSPSDRISTAFQKLIPAAAKLNDASQNLSKPVSDVEASLQKLNLGVACFTALSEHEDPRDGSFVDWHVGYARHVGRWGIVIRLTKGLRHDPEWEVEDTWFFNDAPRSMKTKAIDKLPELIEGLAAVADKTAEKLVRKTPTAEQLAGAVAALSAPKKK